MSINKRVQRERKSHEDDDVLEESIKLKAKFAHITEYPGLKRLMKKFESSYVNLYEKTVLDYGCGKGLDSLKLLKAGANVYGIDIPTKEELICNGKKKDQLIEELNIKDIFFQDINDLQKSIRIFNPEIRGFELSVFLK